MADEKTLLEMLELTLQVKGYRIISAIDGVEALERFKQDPTVLIS